MPAHRKSRPQTEEDLKEAVTVECLARLEQAFPAEAYDPPYDLPFTAPFREPWHGWTPEVCGVLYAYALGGPEFEEEARSFLRLHGLYLGLLKHLREIEGLCEAIRAREGRGDDDALAEALQKDLFPLERFARLFGEETTQDWNRRARFHLSGPTARQAFISYTDDPIVAEPWSFSAWNFRREASNADMACVALAAGDFPPLNVGEDTPAQVINRMATIMGTERRRLWLEETGGRYEGPNKPHRAGH